MSSITRELVIDASPSRIWPALADVSYVHNWHPKVERSPALTETLTGVGAQRTCHFYDGTSVKEEVILSQGNKRIEIAIIEASMPIRDAVAAFDLEEIAPGRTRVTVTMSYAMKMGPIGWLMNIMMVKRMMTGLLGEVLKGLRSHIIDGAYVGRNGALMTTPA